MHLRVALAVLVIRRTRRGDESSGYGAAFLKHQALLAEQTIDAGQDAFGQLVFFQPVAKSEDGALVKQASMRVQLGKLAVQRSVKEGFLHRRIRQAAPLLEKVNAQHRLQGKGRVPCSAFTG